MSSALKQLVKAFGEEVGKLRFRLPVSYVYNPLDYAWAGQEAFLDKFFPFDAHGEVERPTLLVSMNPGPHGMSQSGVAFGAPAIVREWMGIDLPHDAVRPPPVVCPSRPIFGFSPVPITPATNDEPTATAPECRSGNVKKSKKKRTPKRAQPSLRQEASGKRIYVDWAMNAYPSAEAFFKEFFIYPYCPLQFMAASGSNITPDELHREDRAKLYDVCNLYLRKMILLIRPSRVIAIGNFAHERLHSAFAKNDHHDLLEGLTVGKIPHPRQSQESTGTGDVGQSRQTDQRAAAWIWRGRALHWRIQQQL